MPRPNIHRYYLNICNVVATRSTCPRRMVGCVITDEQHRVLSTGHNGVPKGSQHCIDIPCPGAQDKSGDNRRCEAIHAEMNAIIWAIDRRFMHTLYCTVTPCFECAKAILATSIKRVIVCDIYAGDTSGYNMLLEHGIPVYQYTDEPFYHDSNKPGFCKDEAGLKLL